MKPRVDATVTFDTVPHRDAAVPIAQARLRSALTFDDAVLPSEDHDGRPTLVAMARYFDEPSAAGVEAQMKTLIQLPGALASLVSYHLCPHDDPSEAWYDCKSDLQATYRETVA